MWRVCVTLCYSVLCCVGGVGCDALHSIVLGCGALGWVELNWVAMCCGAFGCVVRVACMLWVCSCVFDERAHAATPAKRTGRHPWIKEGRRTKKLFICCCCCCFCSPFFETECSHTVTYTCVPDCVARRLCVCCATRGRTAWSGVWRDTYARRGRELRRGRALRRTGLCIAASHAACALPSRCLRSPRALPGRTSRASATRLPRTRKGERDVHVPH